MMNWIKKLWDWCCDEDWIVIAIPAIILEILLYATGQWGLFFMGLTFALVVLFWEWWNIKRTGFSMSDQFRTWKREHKGMAKAILLAIGAVLLALIFHFSVNIS